MQRATNFVESLSETIAARSERGGTFIDFEFGIPFRDSPAREQFPPAPVIRGKISGKFVSFPLERTDNFVPVPNLYYEVVRHEWTNFVTQRSGKLEERLLSFLSFLLSVLRKKVSLSLYRVSF